MAEGDLADKASEVAEETKAKVKGGVGLLANQFNPMSGGKLWRNLVITTALAGIGATATLTGGGSIVLGGAAASAGTGAAAGTGTTAVGVASSSGAGVLSSAGHVAGAFLGEAWHGASVLAIGAKDVAVSADWGSVYEGLTAGM